MNEKRRLAVLGYITKYLKIFFASATIVTKEDR